MLNDIRKMVFNQMQLLRNRHVQSPPSGHCFWNPLAKQTNSLSKLITCCQLVLLFVCDTKNKIKQHTNTIQTQTAATQQSNERETRKEIQQERSRKRQIQQERNIKRANPQERNKKRQIHNTVLEKQLGLAECAGHKGLIV